MTFESYQKVYFERNSYIARTLELEKAIKSVLDNRHSMKTKQPATQALANLQRVYENKTYQL
jgi:fatty acid-binding protein DegV